MEKHILGNIEFDEKTYKELIDDYSESFTHTSLDIEKEFIKLEKYTLKLRSLLTDNRKLYSKLPEEKKSFIKQKYHFFVTYMAAYKKMIPLFDTNNQEIVDKIYSENFSEFDPYMERLLVFENRKININETGRKVSLFFPCYIERKPILDKAENSRKNHIEAFNYALNEPHIGLNEILKINDTINLSNPDRQPGFKKVNNVITGADFDTMKKEEIPNQLSELIYNYDNNFDMDIKNPNDLNIDEEEQYKRMFEICLKEARFHILFEHLHPFSDGNGRTGRIIMSTNLLKQGVAPPLLTKVMLKEYKKYIDEYNYEALAQMILESSSQLLSTWVTIKRNNEGISPEELIEAKRL